jgi:uncharacterized protein (TIGR00369 family)
MGETGMFVEAVRRRLPPSRAARTLGFEVLDVDPVEGRVEIEFAATDAFANPSGEIPGGFLATMLYDTVGPALLATLSPGECIDTRELRTTFVRPAPVGRLIGRGLVLHCDGHRARLVASLSDPDGTVVATAVATATVAHYEPSNR